MKNKKIINLMLMIFMILLVPSATFAARTKVITASGKYTEENPLELSFADEKIEIEFGEKFEFPFYFKFTGGNYGKYTISVDEEEKVVTFKRIATSSSLDTFKVTPHKKEEGYNYVQPGATYNDAFNKLVFKTPLYKIESIFTFQNGSEKPKRIETVLGNSTLRKVDNNPDVQSDSRVYVFAASGLPESSTIKFSQGQVSNKASVVVTEDFGRFGFSDTAKKYLVTGAGSIQDITSASKETYNFSGSSADLVYAFWGVTSEILNDNETNTIEEILTKILLSVGGVFRGVVTAVGGQNLTIDSLIFNQYEDTKIGFWDGGGTYVDVFTSVINGWHNAFTKWTAYILVIVLVAVGIRAILLAGTPNQKKIQGMVVGWIIAAGLLYIGPMFLKYAVSINDAFVAALRDQSKYSIYSVYNTDFLEKYGITYDMQLGEDSETVKLEDQLMGLYGKIEEDLEENEKALKELNSKLASYQNGIFSWLLNDKYKVYGYDINMVYQARRINQVKAMINSYVNAGHTDSGDVVTFANQLVQTVEGGVWSGFTEQKIKDDLIDYAESYARVKELEQALAATERAIQIVHKGIDLESTMKARAGETYRLVYVLVWYIMIYQLVVLLFIYYKRMITVGVLIIIYPLAVMMYAIEKVMGIEKTKSLSTWLSEYLVNVFVQSVHALVYIMLVEAGLRVFEDDEDNWLLFLFAVFAIFPAEAIIKSIMGMKAKSISDAKKSLTASKMLDYALIASSAVKAYGTIQQVEDRFDAKAKLEEQKNANKDKNKEFNRKVSDKVATKVGGAFGKTEEAQKFVEERNKRRAAADERTAKKREAAKKRQERMKKMAMATQGIRNAVALGDAITTAGALGFDSEDFVLGFSTAGYVSGSKFKPAKVKDSKTSSAPTTQKKNGDRYANSQTSSNATSNTQGTTRAAEQARNATRESGSSTTSQGGSSKRSKAASRRYQDQYRSRLAEKTQGGEADVTKGNPIYSTSENNEDNDF